MKHLIVCLIISIISITIGCATGKEVVRNDYIPCDVCGKYDDRAVFLYDISNEAGKHKDLFSHKECFNNLIKELDKK